MSPEGSVVIEVFGEGKTDVGHDPKPQPPRNGVVPILLHTLCGRPGHMLVRRHGVPFLQQKGTGKGLWQKVRFAKRQAYYRRSHAAVFVVDSEGSFDQKRADLEKGRDQEFPNFPMAVGVAHPCIEAWLLADGRAIQRGLGLGTAPSVPSEPEKLAAPCRDRKNNPKTVLARAAGAGKRDLSVAEKERIAEEMNDLALVGSRCPKSFAPFAVEVEQHIRPLF